MTLIELLLCIGVLTILLGMLAATANAVRTTNADEQTRSTLRLLRMALNQYHQDTGHWPVCDTDTALLVLLDNPTTARLLQSVPVSTDGQRYARVLDGYGEVIRFKAVGANYFGRPDFVSAGPDGTFGDPASTDADTAAAASDNIYGSDTEGATP